MRYEYMKLLNKQERTGGEDMTRKEYRKEKQNTFNKWFLIRFAQIFAYLAGFLVLEFLLICLWILSAQQKGGS